MDSKVRRFEYDGVFKKVVFGGAGGAATKRKQKKTSLSESMITERTGHEKRRTYLH